MMRAWAAAIIALLMLAAVLSAASEERYRVTLSASPEGCAEALEGAGTYAKGEEVTIRAVPKVGCKFVKWTFVKGGIPDIQSNVFTLYAYSDIDAVALFEYLYERPTEEGGEVIERLYVSFASNVSKSIPLTLPKTVFVRRGETVLFSVQEEVFYGDLKLVFLYWEGPDGLRINSPSASVTVERSMTLVAHYAVLRKFIEEYFPENVFTEVRVAEVSLGQDRVAKPVGLLVKGANVTLPLGAKVPRPMLNLIEPVYETYRVLRIFLYSPEGVPVYVNGAEKLLEVGENRVLVKEGDRLSVLAPAENLRVRLENIYASSHGLTIQGSKHGEEALLEARADQVDAVVITYSEKRHAELLGIPIVGFGLYKVAELGYSFIPKEAPPAAAVGIVLSLFAAVAAGSVLAYRKASRVSVARLVPRGAIAGVIEALTSRRPSARPMHPEPSPKPGGRLRLRAPSYVADKLAQLMPSTSRDNGLAAAEAPQTPVLYEPTLKPEDVESFMKAIEEGRGGEFPSSIMQLIRLDEETFEKARACKGLRFRRDSTIHAYSREASILAGLLMEADRPVSYLYGGDEASRSRVAEAAASIARMVHKTVEDLEGAVKAASKSLRRLEDYGRALRRVAAGAGVLITKSVDVDSKIIAAASLAGIKIIVLSDVEVDGGVPLRELSEEELAGILASMLAEKGLLRRVGLKDVEEAAHIASMLRGVTTLEAFVGLVEKVPSDEALKDLWRSELMATFPTHVERAVMAEILRSCPTYEEAKAKFVTAMRQLSPAADGEAEWARFFAKLRRLGVRLEGSVATDRNSWKASAVVGGDSCPRCGIPVTKYGANFCPRCGASLRVSG